MRKIANKQRKPSAIALTGEAAKQRRKIILGELNTLIQTSDVKMAVIKRINELKKEEKKWEEEGSKARLTFLMTKA